MITSSTGIKSSSSISNVPWMISVRRLSPYFSFISNNSFLMISKIRSSFARISFKSAIRINKLFNSSSIFSLSKPARRCNCISLTALACLSDIPNSSINLCWMISVVLLVRINWMISSIWSKAFFKPSKICALASALFNSNCVLRRITSSWWDK